MTRGEAIEILNRDDDSMRKGYFCINDFKAIEVLKSEETCEDCISRQSAINAMLKIEQHDVEKYGCSIPEGFDSEPAIEVLNNLPSITPEQKIGRWWERDTYPQESRSWDCSECQEIVFEKSNFCPNCGAKMEVDVDDSN